MALTYLLNCGNCGKENYIDMQLTDLAISWVCQFCDNENSTSLATNNGQLITDWKKSKAIIKESKIPKNVKKVIPKDKSKDELANG